MLGDYNLATFTLFTIVALAAVLARISAPSQAFGRYLIGGVIERAPGSPRNIFSGVQCKVLYV
jgi:hypothetical protein